MPDRKRKCDLLTATPELALTSLTVLKLKERLQAKSLKTSGKKAELIRRLQQALDSEHVSEDMKSHQVTAAHKKAKNSRSLPLKNISIVISETYTKGSRKSMTSQVTRNGGVVVTNWDEKQDIDFFVQCHNDEETDDRLEVCGRANIPVVSFQYLQECIVNNAVIPYCLWAIGSDPSPYLNPRVDRSLGTLKASKSALLGQSSSQVNVLGIGDYQTSDPRGRETEELNQTYQDYVSSNWFKPNEPTDSKEIRPYIYILPITCTGKQTNKKNANVSSGLSSYPRPCDQRTIRPPSADPTDSALLRASADFLAAYFCCEIKTLTAANLAWTPVALKRGKKGGKKRGRKDKKTLETDSMWRVSMSGQDVHVVDHVIEDTNSREPLLHVLDLVCRFVLFSLCVSILLIMMMVFNIYIPYV